MLRVGLTGGIACGKSTVGQMLVARGAHYLSADELAHQLYAPGAEVYDAVVDHFGREIINSDGTVNRKKLASIVFPARIGELNAIVHPAVIDLQRRLMHEAFTRDPKAVAVIESALIFEVARDAKACGDKDSVLADWRRRIDRVIVVTAPEEVKVARFVARLNLPAEKRAAAETDARNRLAHQIADAEKAAQADYVIDNSRDLAFLDRQVRALWPTLKEESNNSPSLLSLK